MLLIRVLLSLIVLSIPLFGVWLGSSLAAFHNGPRWLAVLAGALLFPGLPLLWEWRWARKRAAKEAARPAGSFFDDMRAKRPRPGLRLTDRLLLRTLLVNALFLAAMVTRFPDTAVTALNARGDWFLDDLKGAWVGPAQQTIWMAASGLEWAHRALNPNEWEKMREGDDPLPDPDQPQPKLPEPEPKPEPKPNPEPNPEPKPEPKPEPAPEPNPEPEPEPTALQWPLPSTLHPLVADMPPAAEGSIASVGAFILDNEPNPWLRVKALHDYAADRVIYDYPALDAGRYPPQDSETVFSRKIGVCAGYANLLVALGKVTGDEIVYVTGDSRDQSGKVGGRGHAWNAARIEGEWTLIDVTWDAGFKKNGKHHKKYSTDYLFTPPAYFGMNHLPDDQRWQLVDQPISMGTFVRQPMLNPAFFAHGLALVSPNRSQVDVQDRRLPVRLANPNARSLIVKTVPHGAPMSTKGQPCQVSTGTTTTADCQLYSKGAYDVRFFAAEDREDTHWYVGQIQANSVGPAVATR